MSQIFSFGVHVLVKCAITYTAVSHIFKSHSSVNFLFVSVYFCCLCRSIPEINLHIVRRKALKETLNHIWNKAVVVGVALQTQAGAAFEETNYCSQQIRVSFLLTSLQVCSQCYCPCFMSAQAEISLKTSLSCRFTAGSISASAAKGREQHFRAFPLPC